ncbi:MAG: phosphatidylglycerophosphatase A, partial [Planctomycetes bacterium]|nr:phosphatidylglycerophosphatase A [Planctomycetota bacterium]
MRSFLYKAAATFLFTGCLPWFPGTWATLACLGLYAAALGAGADFRWAIPVAGAVAIAAGLPLAHRADAAFGRHDPPQFVLDEAAGFCVSLLFQADFGLWTGGAAFLAFRFFDSLKPWPIRRMERLPGGWGILADDLAAGVAANVVVRLTLLV